MKGNREHIWCLIAFQVDTEELKENRKVQVPVMAGKRRERVLLFFKQLILYIRDKEMYVNNATPAQVA